MESTHTDYRYGVHDNTSALYNTFAPRHNQQRLHCTDISTNRSQKKVLNLAKNKHPKNTAHCGIRQHYSHVTCRHCHFSPLCLGPKNTTTGTATHSKTATATLPEVPRKHYKKGQNLFGPGDKLEYFAIVREGAVKCFSLNNDGSEQITRFVLPGEALSLEAYASGTQYGFAQAIDATQVCLFSLPQLEKHWQEHPSFQAHCMKLMSASLAKQNTICRLLNKTSADTRLAAFLMDIIHNYTQRNLRSDQIRLPMPRADIGNYLSLALETISRAMSRLEKRGIIQVTGKQVQILDQAALQALVPENMVHLKSGI